MKSFENEYANNRIILRDVVPLEMPLCISIEPSDACNFSCVMCHHSNPEYDVINPCKQNMSIGLFEKCIKDIEQWCVKTGKTIKVMKLYSMGEPLINPNITYMIERVKKANICQLLEITSNVSLLTYELGERIVESGLDVFRASVYSIDEARNRYITGQDRFDVDRIYDNLQHMKMYRDKKGVKKPFISAKMIDSYSEENERFIKKYSSVADEAYIDKIMDMSGTGETIERYYGLENKDNAKQDNSRVRLLDRKCCRYPFTHMTIKGDGKVVVCCNDWMNATCIGDAKINSLEKIWNSKELYDFRCMMLKTKGLNIELCKNCEIPLRDFSEDDIDGFPIEKLSYWSC